MDEQNTPATEGNPATEVSVDPFVAQAVEKGWKPLEQFDGNPELWVDAKEFVKRAPLFDRLEKTNKRLKETEKIVADLTKHIHTVGQAAYDRAIADLKREKLEAVRNADDERVIALDNEIDKLKEEAPKAPDKNAIDPVIVEWVNKPENKWFTEDSEMKTFAEIAHDAIIRNNPNIDTEESLKKVTAQVKRAFPEKFANPARAAASPVESAVIASGGKRTVFTYRDLNEEQRRIADNFDRKGIMKKDEYIKQLAESGQIGA